MNRISAQVASAVLRRSAAGRRPMSGKKCGSWPTLRAAVVKRSITKPRAHQPLQLTAYVKSYTTANCGCAPYSKVCLGSLAAGPEWSSTAPILLSPRSVPRPSLSTLCQRSASMSRSKTLVPWNPPIISVPAALTSPAKSAPLPCREGLGLHAHRCNRLDALFDTLKTRWQTGFQKQMAS